MKPATRTERPLTLLYDGACPLCAAEIAFLRARDHAGRLDFIDVSPAGRGDTVMGVSRADALAAMTAIDADGRVLRGVSVFRAAYSAIGMRRVVAAISLPLLGGVLDRLYPWFARNRHRLPRWLPRVLFGRAAASGAACRDGVCRID